MVSDTGFHCCFGIFEGKKLTENITRQQNKETDLY